MTALRTENTAPWSKTQSSRGIPQVRGLLRLRFESRENGQTILSQCEQQLPLRVVRAFQLDDGGALVHLHNLSGGVLGDDHLEVTVDVGEDAVAQITSTGATRIYRSRKDSLPALQKLRLQVEHNGLCEYLPDQLIPFSGSNYRQETQIDLGENSGLFWWETIAPGRAAANELFAYRLLQLKTRISALGKPIALEHIRLDHDEPSIFSPVRLGNMYRYFSTFYICRVGIESSRWLKLEELLGELAEQLSQPPRIVWGVSSLRAHGLVVRALSAAGGEIMTHLLGFWRVAKRFLYARDPVLPRKIY